jgi:multiple sugar transport system substrate-binding protein
MKRVVAVMLFVTVIALTACGSSSSGSANGANGKVTITLWSAFTDRELGILNHALEGFHAKHPDITVRSVGGQGDDKITAAIQAGNPPDVAMSFTADNVGQFCKSGAFTDLGPRISNDHVDLSQLNATALSYTQYQGTRCVLPALSDAYGLYYNKDLLAKAGYTEPPKSLSELTTMAEKLTQRDSQGHIKVAGFVPLMGFYENAPAHFAPMIGAQWLDSKGKSAVASDPDWASFLTWQKKLVDWYGYGNLKRFTAGAGDEFSPQNDFETGKIAMMIDGEYREAFVQAEHPELKFAAAPFPVADDKPELYGATFATGNLIGIPKGASHPDAAWQLVKYLSTETAPMVELANGLKNLPTVNAATTSPDLKVDPVFQVFLTVFANKNTASVPATAAGSAMQDTFQTFIEKWQSGGVSDLQSGLTSTAKQIDGLLKLQAGGGPP